MLLRAVVVASVIDAVVRIRHGAALQRWKGRTYAEAGDEGDDESIAHDHIVRS
jgi:hypothetical protein